MHLVVTVRMKVIIKDEQEGKRDRGIDIIELPSPGLWKKIKP